MNATAPGHVWCVYPVSGAYTQFQRILFWGVIILILLFQSHTWLTAGAIAFAVTYSVTASVHAVFLGPQARSAYDADLFGWETVLQSSIFAALTVLLLVVPSHPCRLDDHAARGCWDSSLSSLHYRSC